MRKRTKTAETKNLKLAFFFGFIVLFIILVSIVFRAVEVVRSSRFDGDNSFTVAVVNKTNTDFVSVSPTEGKLTKLRVNGLSKTQAENLPVPVNAYVITNSDFSQNPRSYFAKLFLAKKNKKTNLTILDFLRLSLYSRGVGGENVEELDIASSSSEVDEKTAVLFQDPKIQEARESIEVKNTTEVGGLGANLAQVIVNFGGNVVLVSTSKESADHSKILYRRGSYTVNKLSEILDMKTEVMTDDSISDIVIVIGNDKKEGRKFE